MNERNVLVLVVVLDIRSELCTSEYYNLSICTTLLTNADGSTTYDHDILGALDLSLVLLEVRDAVNLALGMQRSRWRKLRAGCQHKELVRNGVAAIKHDLIRLHLRRASMYDLNLRRAFWQCGEGLRIWDKGHVLDSGYDSLPREGEEVVEVGLLLYEQHFVG